MNRRVTVEDAHLFAWARNTALAARFPFLKALAVRPKTCCGKATVDTNTIKASIAGLTGDDLQTLKSRLRATTLRVVYKHGDKIEKKDI